MIAKEKIFKKKYKKYNRILNRPMRLNACSNGISIATGKSSVATFSTFVGIPVSAALGAASMTGAVSSGIISVLTKKYQKKLNPINLGLLALQLTLGGGVFHPPSITPLSLKLDCPNFAQSYFQIR